MLLEQGDDDWCEQNAPPALLGFRLSFDVSVAGPAGENASNLEGVLREINILPFECQDFTSPHPGGNRKDKKRLQCMPFSDGQELLRLFHREGLNLIMHATRW